VDVADRAEARRGILDEILGLFRAAYAWETWGRLLVHVAVGEDGRAVVVDVVVEDIVGDEARLERAFEGSEVRGSLAAVARAAEALVALEDLEIEAMGGGTFIRTRDGDLAFLPGLVRSPSVVFDRARDGVVARVRAKNEALREAFGIGSDAKVIPALPGANAGSKPRTGAKQRATVRRAGAVVATVDAVVLGTFSRPRRSLVWAAANPSVDDATRAASTALLDSMPDRGAWEISTFGFTTDEPTAWALAAWVADSSGFDGLTAVDTDEGVIFVALRDARASDPPE